MRLAGTGPEGPNTYDISADGTTIVGNSGCFGFLCSRPALWTETDGLVVLGDSGWATGVSADGSVVVGRVTIAGPYFRWTESEGLVELDLAVGDFTRAYGDMHVSANGQIAVGGLYNTVAGLPEAIIWDSNNGARSIRQLLIQAGIDLTGWRLDYPTAVSGDGGTIVGSGINPDGNAEAWLARLSIGQPGDTNADGQVNIDDLNRVRNHFGAGTNNVVPEPGGSFWS